MALLVVTRPHLAAADLAHIEALRERHDVLYRHVVDAHFTLVFPTQLLSREALVSHVRAVAGRWLPFDFVLRCAVIDRDAFAPWWHTFLVPDEGYSSFVRLHDALYRGELAGELRLDLPFIPHVGVGNADSADVSKQLVDSLNAQPFAYPGHVDALDVVRFAGGRVTDLARIALGPVA